MGYTARQKKVKAKIIGAESIVKALEKMGDGASDILMDATKVGGDIALKDAINNCPKDTGRLAQSIELEEMKATKTRATVKIGYDKSIKYGTFVELGTKTRKANPFMRKAVDENIDKINEKIVDKIAEEVVKKW